LPQHWCNGSQSEWGQFRFTSLGAEQEAFDASAKEIDSSAIGANDPLGAPVGTALGFAVGFRLLPVSKDLANPVGRCAHQLALIVGAWHAHQFILVHSPHPTTTTSNSQCLAIIKRPHPRLFQATLAVPVLMPTSMTHTSLLP
jgi:hypothetical protein